MANRLTVAAICSVVMAVGRPNRLLCLPSWTATADGPQTTPGMPAWT